MPRVITNEDLTETLKKFRERTDERYAFKDEVPEPFTDEDFEELIAIIEDSDEEDDGE